MKVLFHFPTEQYGFVEMEFEDGIDSIDEAIELYNASKTSQNAPEQGLGVKEWQSTLDRYLSDGTGETDVYLRMSEKQKACFQEIKKAYKRIEAKNK